MKKIIMPIVIAILVIAVFLLAVVAIVFDTHDTSTNDEIYAFGNGKYKIAKSVDTIEWHVDEYKDIFLLHTSMGKTDTQLLIMRMILS